MTEKSLNTNTKDNINNDTLINELDRIQNIFANSLEESRKFVEKFMEKTPKLGSHFAYEKYFESLKNNVGEEIFDMFGSFYETEENFEKIVKEEIKLDIGPEEFKLYTNKENTKSIVGQSVENKVVSYEEYIESESYIKLINKIFDKAKEKVKNNECKDIKEALIVATKIVEEELEEKNKTLTQEEEKELLEKRIIALTNIMKNSPNLSENYKKAIEVNVERLKELEKVKTKNNDVTKKKKSKKSFMPKISPAVNNENENKDNKEELNNNKEIAISNENKSKLQEFKKAQDINSDIEKEEKKIKDEKDLKSELTTKELDDNIKNKEEGFNESSIEKEEEDLGLSEKNIKEKEENKLIPHITKIENKGNIHIINFDCECKNINNDDFLKLINENYKVGDLKGEGAQASVYTLDKNNVIRIQKKFDEKDETLDKIIKNTEKINPYLEAMKDGSVVTTNTFVVVDKNGKFVTFEIQEEKEMNLSEALGLKGEPAFNELEREKVASQLLDAVETRHNSDIVHMDIKPDNILIDKNGNAYLTDYGLAANINNNEKANRGTLYYIAPETSEEGAKVNVENDVYSLGTVFLDMFMKFDKKKYSCFMELIINGKRIDSYDKLFNFKKNGITQYIKPEDVDLTAFLSEETINKSDKKDLNELREKIVNFLRSMVEVDPQKRVTITEAKKEFEKIKEFVKERFNVNEKEKFNEKDSINSYKNNINEIINDTEISKLKNGVVWEKNVNDQDELKDMLSSLSDKEPLSKNAIECLNILKNCISDDNKLILPDSKFYKKYNELKKISNKKEYLIVMDQLIKLRELKLNTEIERLEEMKNTLGKDNLVLNEEIENLKDLHNDTKLTTRIFQDNKTAELLFVKDIKKYRKKEKDLRNLDEKIKNINVKLEKEIQNITSNALIEEEEEDLALDEIAQNLSNSLDELNNKEKSETLTIEEINSIETPMEAYDKIIKPALEGIDNAKIDSNSITVILKKDNKIFAYSCSVKLERFIVKLPKENQEKLKNTLSKEGIKEKLNEMSKKSGIELGDKLASILEKELNSKKGKGI